MGGPPRLKIPRRQQGQSPSPSVFGPNGFRSAFSTPFLLQLLRFLLSNPFRTRNLTIFDPPEPSKSIIFIKKVVIFVISTFSVRMLSFLLLGKLLASFLVPFQPSSGGLGAILGPSWVLPGGFLGVSWASWWNLGPGNLLRAS